MKPLRILLAAPHRLAFLAGSIGLGAIVGWWTMVLVGLAEGRQIVPEGTVPSAMLHAPMLLFGGFAPFVFGFLLTVFPRWMGYPDLIAARYGQAALPVALGTLCTCAGLWCGLPMLLAAGLALQLVGWLAGLVILAGLLRLSHADRKPVCWHAWSAWAALALGWVALAAILAFVVKADGLAWRFGYRLGLGGFLLPVFLTVAHRMIPFFAGTAIPGYQRWKPDWLLGAIWLGLMTRLIGEIGERSGIAAAGNLALAGLTLTMAWRWWPRGPAPGLLNVLIWGFLWAPAGFLLDALAEAGVPLGLAPTHALAMGFCGSLLVAMVTRVTQGHSGRPLAMFPLAWIAFCTIQLATGARILSAVQGDPALSLAVAATMLTLGITPWALRNAAVYLAPRRDGRPG